MKFDIEDIKCIDANTLHSNDCFAIRRKDNRCLCIISFDDLCKAIAKQLIKDGVIPGEDE